MSEKTTVSVILSQSPKAQGYFRDVNTPLATSGGVAVRWLHTPKAGGSEVPCTVAALQGCWEWPALCSTRTPSLHQALVQWLFKPHFLRMGPATSRRVWTALSSCLAGLRVRNASGWGHAVRHAAQLCCGARGQPQATLKSEWPCAQKNYLRADI